MSSWALQDVKAKLSELVDTARRDGPQIITRRGVDQVAVVPIEQWKRMGSTAKPTLLEVLQSGPQFDLNIPVRGRMHLRKYISRDLVDRDLAQQFEVRKHLARAKHH